MFGVIITMLLLWLIFKVFKLALSAAWGFVKVTALVMGVVAAILMIIGITIAGASLMLFAAFVAAAALLLLRLLL